ncbi:MAG: hypothetical protein U1F23_01540 [Lysobacterales bacterium]
MKGPLTLLSTAVLLALAGSTADATSPAIQRSIHTSTPAPRPASQHRQAPAGGILWDQTAGMTGQNFLVATFSTSAYAVYSSQGADDFVVPSGQTWTVNGFVLPVAIGTSSPPTTGNPRVWSDDGDGHPGTTLACDGTNTPITFANDTVSMTLATPCVLPEGSYWFEFSTNANTSNYFVWWMVNGPIANQPGQWQNPNGGFETACSAWSDLAACFPSVPSSQIGGDWAFQIIGNASSPAPCTSSSLTCLTVGMALYDSSNPTQCGTATYLFAAMGDLINICYTFTNYTSETLDYHTLSDNLYGTVFASFSNPVFGGGGTMQVNSTRGFSVNGIFTPTATWIAQDVPPNYSVTSSAGASSSNPNFIDITVSGTALSLFDSEFGVGITMPFSIPLYGQVSNALCVDANGWITFGTTSSLCYGAWSNSSLPTSSFSTPVIFPYWDDMGSGGTVYTGVAPGGDPFVIEYYNRNYYGDSSSITPPLTFEVQLWQDGTIKFAYDTVSGGPGHANGVSATIGLQHDQSFANQWSYNSSAVSDYLTLTWTPNHPTVYAATAGYTINVGAGAATVSPAALSGSAAPGDTTTATLAIGNTGNRDLVWYIGEAPANAPPKLPEQPARVTPRGHAMGTPPADIGHVDPRKRASALAAARRHPPHHAPAGSPVPAFGETYTSSGVAYVAFDAADPGTLQTINASMGTNFFAGTFASNDFSTEYAISYPDGDLVAIDTSTGALQVIGNTGFGSSLTGIRWDPTSGMTYAMASSCGGPSSLYTLDLGTGATTLVGSTSESTCIIDIAIDPYGAMYGVDALTSSLVRIYKNTGASQTIGPLGSTDANFGEGLDFDQATGTL